MTAKPTKTEISAAWNIVGNQNRHCLRQMIKALKLHSWLNTPEDNRRLAAAKIAVRYQNPRYT